MYFQTIELENAYNIPQRFRVHTSDERLVSPESEYYSLAANSTAPLQLNFKPIARGALPMNVQVKEGNAEKKFWGIFADALSS